MAIVVIAIEFWRAADEAGGEIFAAIVSRKVDQVGEGVLLAPGGREDNAGLGMPAEDCPELRGAAEKLIHFRVKRVKHPIKVEEENHESADDCAGIRAETEETDGGVSIWLYAF